MVTQVLRLEKKGHLKRKSMQRNLQVEKGLSAEQEEKE